MRALVLDLASRFQQDGTDIVDLGCSRGEAMASLLARFYGRNRFVGVEVSEPMLIAARDRFAREIDRGLVAIQHLDLRETYPQVNASVTLSVLTLMFVPLEHRARVVRDMYDHLLPGGALLLVEKILGSCPALDERMVASYYDFKRRNGYSQEEITRKRLSLEGVLVPVTAAWNEDLLRMAGFTMIDTFWRWQNFAGWVAVK
jgi:tRNA (cmo5U34)-methyltransferase